MIEEIIKESDKAKDFYGSTDVIGLKTLFRILDNQPDYKSAWEEFKQYFIDIDCDVNDVYCDEELKKIEELEQKYNLGGE